MTRRVVGTAAAAAGILLIVSACAAPISTQRSPYHLRVVEVRNDSGRDQMLTIEPSSDQHLGAATTFTGRLKPGEVKVLYLYHGFDYMFRIMDEDGRRVATENEFSVHRNMGLVFAGDSLVADAHLAIEIGEPTTTFADSVQALDPFGIRSSDTIEPDTTNVRGRPDDRGANAQRGGRAR